MSWLYQPDPWIQSSLQRIQPHYGGKQGRGATLPAATGDRQKGNWRGPGEGSQRS